MVARRIEIIKFVLEFNEIFFCQINSVEDLGK